ncbi:MAG: GAF domain-containing protein [Leptolyngbyaceae cyanobacterium SM1_3_5]|nr:GAF domain-containing protein [Leptolyngbyaceae cyanobacterium SM1_3_5]
MNLEIEQGQVNLRHQIKAPEAYLCPSTASTPVWGILLQTKQPFVIDHSNAKEYVFQNTYEHQANQIGLQLAVNLLLTMGDEPIGLLSLGSTQRTSLTPEELELAQALTQQATLAIQLTRLAEEVKQAAIAREQEQAALERAAELVKTNQALKNSLDVLATDPDIDSFIGQLLSAIATQFNSPIVEYWYHTPKQMTYLGMMHWQQRTYSRSQIVDRLPHHPGVAGYRVPEALLDGESLYHRHRPLYIPNLATSALADAADWYEQQGIQQLLNFPMTLGDESIGAIAIYLPATQPFTTEDQELAQALTHQATLAVQLTRLAEEAKQLALIQERAFTAREIHDTLAQDFGGILMQLQAADRLYTLKPEKSQGHITHARDLARRGLAEARSSIWVLSQEGEAYSKLSEVLQQLVAQMAIGSDTQTTTTITGTPYSLSSMQGMNLLRIAQESLNNALRHANAQTISLLLDYAPNQLHLQIIDDGIGFAASSPGKGFGLRGMQQRADSIGAQFNLQSEPDRGTAIEVLLPIA